MLKLPRALEDTEDGFNILNLIERTKKPLYESSRLLLPHLPLTESVRSVLCVTRKAHHLRGGFEQIVSFLDKERKGISLLREGRDLEQGERCSRLLLLANDGSLRFYKHCESLLLKNEPRVLGICLDVTGSQLGSAFFGKDTVVKVALVSHKDFVVKVLRAFLDEKGTASP